MDDTDAACAMQNGGGGGVQFEVLNPPDKFLEFKQWFSNPRLIK